MDSLAGHYFIPTCHAVPLTPERSAAILDEALRRIDRAIPGPVDLDALRQALETEMAKGPRSLVASMKVGRRRALDRIGRQANKEAARASNLSESGQVSRISERTFIEMRLTIS